jgi:hypothetical protein
MGSIEFPSTPIRAANTHPRKDEQNREPPFTQPTLEGFETLAGTEVELGNCLVTSAVTYKKRAKGSQWQCHMYASPDLLHQEQEGAYEAVAHGTNADLAQSYHLRPGDRAVMTGRVQEQTVVLENGEEITMNRLTVSAITVIARAKRKSITLFEQQKK